MTSVSPERRLADDAVQNARALLQTLDRSPLTELYLKTDAFELFIAKQGGVANPMRRPSESPVPALVEADTRDATEVLTIRAHMSRP